MNRNLYGFDRGYRALHGKAVYRVTQSRIPLTVLSYRRVIPARKGDS